MHLNILFANTVFGFPVTRGQKSDFNIVFFVEGEDLATCSSQENSSHFRGFFTGSDRVKNSLITCFDIFYPVKNTVKVQRFFNRFFTASFTGSFTGFCIGQQWWSGVKSGWGGGGLK